MKKVIVEKCLSALLILSLIAVGAGFFASGCSKEEEPVPPVVDEPKILPPEKPEVIAVDEDEILRSLNSSNWDPTALPSVDSRMLTINQQIVSKFPFRGVDHSILGDQSFWSKNSSPPYSEDAIKEFRQFTFYIFPEIMIDRIGFEKSFEKKIPFKRKDYSGAPLYQIRFDIELSDQELREKAAEHINKKFAGANITKENVAIVPLGYFRISASAPQWDRDLCICSYPDRVSGPASLGNIPNRLPARFIGTQDQLEILKDIATFSGEFMLPGFTVKQNSLRLTHSDMAKSDFRHLLTGRASWELLLEYKTKTTGETKNFLAILNEAESSGKSESKVSSKSWVTRNQVRQVALETASQLSMVIWEETAQGPNFYDGVEEYVDYLLNVAEHHREVNIDGETFDLKGLKEIDDIRPDLYRDITAAIKKNAEMSDNFDFDHKGKVKKTGTEASGKTHVGQASDFITAEDMTWEQRGETWVPKSIDLYQFAESSFEGSDAVDLVYRKAETTTQKHVTPVYMTHEEERKVEKDYDGTWNEPFKIRTEHCGSGDAEVDTAGDGQTKVTVTTTAKKEGSTINLTIRIDIDEVHGDKTNIWGETKKTYGVLDKIKNRLTEELKGVENIAIEKIILPDQDTRIIEIRGVNRVWVNRRFEGAKHIQEWANVRIDTKGGDDLKHTGIDGTINIPYTATIRGTKKEKIYTMR